MNHPDEVVERVLTSLRTAEPPTGMQRRVLEAMQAKAGSPSRSPWQRRLPWALAPLALIALATTLITPKHRVPQVSLLRPGSTQTTEVKAVPATPKRVQVSRALTRVSRPSTSPEKARVEQAESYPAPPLPLTEQEQLLLQIAHHRNQANLAVLNPAKQEVQIAKESAQFEDFFKDRYVRIAPQPPEEDSNPQPEERGNE